VGVPIKVTHELESFDRGLPYASGPQWLAENVLQDKWVLAVAGTHGKSTTASMLAWILEDAGLDPGFLIGGIARNFNVSARDTPSSFFVIEADEYDTAFFDKRSKFLHYLPELVIINNLEFDHADIFDNLAAIQKSFSHLVRIVPRNGMVLVNADDANALAAVAEEIFFRRLTFGWLMRWGSGIAVIGSAGAFALVHARAYGLPALPLDLAAGILFGWQRWSSGGWVASALTHVVANLLQMR